MKIKCTCKTCGKDFYVHECYIKRDGKRLYCSSKCYIRTGQNNPRYKPTEGIVNCKGCGKEFKVKPTSLANGKSKKYCSVSCRTNSIGKTVKVCLECGNEFECYKSQINIRKFCSMECRSRNSFRKNKQMSNGINRGFGGKREDLNNMYFRSSWEANYARYLTFLIKNNKILSWQYEVDTFEFFEIKRGTRFYLPDFKVELLDGSFEYHEVKGWVTNKTITINNRMAKYYPDIKVITIDKAWFRTNGRTLSKIIPFWEKHY